MGTYLWKKELVAIWNKLVLTLTEEDLEWLRKYRLFWKEFTSPKDETLVKGVYTDWQIENVAQIYGLSFRIQDIVDAKFRDTDRNIVDHLKNREEPDYVFAGGLPKETLLEVAKILGIQVDKDMSKYELVAKMIH